MVIVLSSNMDAKDKIFRDIDKLSEDNDLEYSDRDHQEFDIIIGHIEDILINNDFHVLIQNFMNKYCNVFDYSEENKLVYMEIFDEYTKTVECYINTHLINRMPSFSMESFISELKKREDLDGEIFEMLFSMSDFLKFKQIILDFKYVKEGIVDDLNLTSCISKVRMNY